ncbi:CRISPR-associated helicase Cas3' [Streptomyces sp. NPDC004647]|uniref:CRISPR-associated helicase Cas3' n=1 Tax=Streptomyces sp. NPDC004647 TaxID=3154671 RepID=UPI0033A2DA48
MRRPFEVVDESAWGKSRGLDPALAPYPLVRHLLDAAAVVLFLWDRYLSENQRRCIARGMGMEEDPARARAFTALCAGLHDIGKLSGFQYCDARARALLSESLTNDPGRIRLERMGHDVAGMHAAATVLAALGFEAGGTSVKGTVRRVAEVIGGHHGRFHEYVPIHPQNQDLLGGPAWARQRQAHAGAVFEALGAPLPPEYVEAPAAVLITGVVILADWLVSQEGYLQSRQRGLDSSLERHFAQSCADAEGLVREAGLLPVELERKDFAETYGITGQPNPLQRSITEELTGAVGKGARGGIALVTAAPGDGKSEAALEAERVLSAAFGTRGFAFLLPTMATSDQMYGRVAAVLARQAGHGAALTLTHSMAWLNSAYAEDELDVGSRVLVCDDADSAARRELDMRPRRWLRGAKRPLLAQYTVGTVDQALMAVLPVRHNALRLMALSGKTFVVDEAHAYDPYMQVLLGRLLNWLGWYGVPVVLLSATLPASVSDRLIKEYLRGAGHERSVLRKSSFPAPYPGWLYVDGESGECSQISAARHREQAAERRMDLGVQVEPVVHGEVGGDRNRLAVIERLLEPVLGEDGGCALVVCNTVVEAQETYVRLCDRMTRRGLAVDDLQLLHARFPADERERRTRDVTAGMGRTGPRPGRRIVVATQVVEQSLDLDADVVISDLAPLALLLQRAGRCWRHEHWWAQHGRPGGRERPAWATEPRLVVLDPLAGGRGVPRQWGEVYAEFLLVLTSEVLARQGNKPIGVPDHVQALVEEVHGDRADRFDWDAPAKSAAWMAYYGRNLAHQSVADILVIPRAKGVTGLHKLHHLHGTEDEWEAVTRLGADAVRLLCAYVQQPDGVLTLDPGGSQALPMPGPDGRLSTADVRAVMSQTIPVNAEWFQGEFDAHRAPAEWAEHPMLGDLLVLRQSVLDGDVRPVKVGGHHLWLDAELGLIRK